MSGRADGAALLDRIDHARQAQRAQTVVKLHQVRQGRGHTDRLLDWMGQQ